MKISGIQKMTLLDYPGKVACTIFLGGCNFRCPFCHNSELLGNNSPQNVTEDEFLAFLKKRQGLLEAVCVSGGEPTLQHDLPDFINRIREMNFLVKLDTNGSRPEVLHKLLDQKLLDYVAMDVKNDQLHYAATCGLKSMDLSPIENSLSQLLIGNIDYELRTTVVEQLHNTQSFVNIAAMLKKIAPNNICKRYYLQPFVDRPSVIFSNFTSPSIQQLTEYKKILEKAAELVEIRGL